LVSLKSTGYRNTETGPEEVEEDSITMARAQKKSGTSSFFKVPYCPVVKRRQNEPAKRTTDINSGLFFFNKTQTNDRTAPTSGSQIDLSRLEEPSKASLRNRVGLRSRLSGSKSDRALLNRDGRILLIQSTRESGGPQR
jgi:hypothetical protein